MEGRRGDLLFSGEEDIQSSVMANKVTGNFTAERSTMVPCIDLATWLEAHTGSDDRLTLKIDIEGAEYDVLERMARHPILGRTAHILVEWHENRLRRRLLELRYLLQRHPITRWSKKRILAIEAA